MRKTFSLLPLLAALLICLAPSTGAAAPPRDSSAHPVDQSKAQDVGDDINVYFVYRGKSMEAPITGFVAQCKGYNDEGILYSSPTGHFLMRWFNIEYILPGWGEAGLIDNKSLLDEGLRPVACPDAYVKRIVKKTEATKKNKAKVEEERYALQDMQVIAFSKTGLDKGLAALAKRDILIEPEAGIELRRIPGKCFEMGDTFDEGADDEKYTHTACVKDFYLGVYEVTQYQWKAIMDSNPSHFNTCDSCPVENVSWYDVQEFLRRLNVKTGKTYRLPTEAEWELAARGGATEKFSGTNNEASIGDYAWYGANAKNTTHRVGQKRPNRLHLFDMSGNVWEWVSDRYEASYYRSAPRDNPSGPATGDHRVNRGGGWSASNNKLRTTARDRDHPERKSDTLGFRIALTAAAADAPKK
jgi:sulfatase modifying factor 1